MLSIIINLHWDFTALSVPLVPRGKRKAWIFRRLEVQFPMGMPVLKVCVSIFFACSHLDTSLKWQIQRISVVNYKQSCRKMTTQCLIAACHGWTVPTPMWFNPCVYYNVASLDYCTVRWVNAAHTVQKKDNKILWTISPVSDKSADSALKTLIISKILLPACVVEPITRDPNQPTPTCN